MYTLTIVGGGAISCGYDSPKDEKILTHINGALQHSEIILDSIIEIKKERQQYILNKWGESFDIFSQLEESIDEYKSDIFIVATPTNSHLKIIEKILSIYCPKLIICEKPIVSNLKEFEILNRLLKKSNTKIITNFVRRFDPSLNALKEIISKTNKKYHFHGTFTKGLIHNGSHMMDLINMLIGHIYNIDYINKEMINNDFFGQFIVQTNFCNGVISNINTDKLSVFELTIYTDIAEIKIIDATKEIFIKYIDKSNLLNGFQTYLLKNELEYTLKKSAYNTFEYVIDLLKDDEKYQKLKLEQLNVNELIFNTQKKLMEL